MSTDATKIVSAKDNINTNFESSLNESDYDSDSSERNDESYNNALTEDLENNLNELKISLYNSIVFSPPNDSSEAQDPALLNKYLRKLKQLYIFANAARHGVMPTSLKYFPKEIRLFVRTTLNLISKLFKENNVAESIPISDCITRKLKEQPFVQGRELPSM